MRKDRMLALAQMLEMIPEEKFHMQYFFSTIDEEGSPHPSDGSHFIKDPYDCNTAACIAGWTQLLIDIESQTNTHDATLQYLYGRSDYYDLSSNVKEYAQRYLDIGPDLGTVLFYAGHGSIWHSMAEELGLGIERDARNLGDEDDYDVEWESIKPRHAAKVLRMIVNNQIPWIKDGYIDRR